MTEHIYVTTDQHWTMLRLPTFISWRCGQPRGGTHAAVGPLSALSVGVNSIRLIAARNLRNFQNRETLHRKTRALEKGTIMKSIFTLVALLLAGLVGKAVEVPQLLSPPDGMEITDVATYFQWLPVAGVTNFEFEVARDGDFHNVVNTKKTTNTGYHKNLYFPKDVLPAGKFFWRVRSFHNGQNSSWSKVRSFSVNTSHPVLPQVVRKIDPEHPLFLMRNRGWDPTQYSEHVQDIIPPGLEHIIVVDDIALAGPSVFERAMKYQELGVDFVVWNNRAQVSLATIEFLFQNYSHCLLL